MLDRVYRCGADGAPAFVEVGAPTDDELQVLLQTVITRVMKLLTRRGVLIEEMGQTYLAEPDDDGEEARTLRPLQAAVLSLVGLVREVMPYLGVMLVALAVITLLPNFVLFLPQLAGYTG